MTVTKSIIENFELSSGVEIYVQASILDRINLSFDGRGYSFMQYMTHQEAKQLADMINKVLSEV